MNFENDQPIEIAPITKSVSDKVWRHSLREMVQILGIWAIFIGWTVGYSYCFGYGPKANIELICGIPSWVFWGVAIPWGAATIVSIAFAMWGIKNDELADTSTETSDTGEKIRD